MVCSDIAKLDKSQPTALILAAGFGSRLGAITKQIPKPLVVVRGCSLLESACKIVLRAGIRQVIINTHYMQFQIAEHVLYLSLKMPGLSFYLSHEHEILNTGGAMKHIAKHSGLSELIVVNADAFLWGRDNPLHELISAWPLMGVDALLYLKTLPSAVRGDFDIAGYPIGSLTRSGRLPLQYVGVGIYKIAALLAMPQEKFGIIDDWMIPEISSERFYGMMLPGLHMDIGTPERLACISEINFY
jgi:MurNAc alpha-1-phosphate uridylyltransferase